MRFTVLGVSFLLVGDWAKRLTPKKISVPHQIYEVHGFRCVLSASGGLGKEANT